MVRIKIILLAGGQASRYNNVTHQHSMIQPNDKLLSDRGNKYLIKFIVSELCKLGEIIIVTRGEQRKQHYSTLLAQEIQNNSIQVIEEVFSNSIGPIGGINSALRICDSSQMVLILPTDLPNVTNEIIGIFIDNAMNAKSFDLVSLVHPNGQVENLVLAGYANKIMKLSKSLIEANIYRVSSLYRLAQKKRFLNSLNIVTGINGKEAFKDLDFGDSTRELKAGTDMKEANINQITNQYIDFGFNGFRYENQSDPTFFFYQYLNWKINSYKKSSNAEIPALIT
ncbi:MAG: NTP transferase domain-containing protein, partial [Candidatus Hodarchaeota archaeon]